jgi:hypothetical protein
MNERPAVDWPRITANELEPRTHVMWHAYFSDNGRREKSPVLVLGGWIAPTAKWTEFGPDWQQMLDQESSIE